MSELSDELRSESAELVSISGRIEEIATELEGQSPGPTPQGVIQYINPVFDLGAADQDPSIGEGTLKAWYIVNEFVNGTRIDLQLYLSSVNGFPGLGTGSYEIYLPDDIEPDIGWYAGNFNLWISGGGISEFDGSVKWTFRNPDKGPKLIFTVNGAEWSPDHPKKFADLKLRANISYYL